VHYAREQRDRGPAEPATAEQPLAAGHRPEHDRPAGDEPADDEQHADGPPGGASAAASRDPRPGLADYEPL
jgi:hypothetical protein